MFTSARKVSGGILVFQTRRVSGWEAKMARDDVPRTDLAYWTIMHLLTRFFVAFPAMNSEREEVFSKSSLLVKSQPSRGHAVSSQETFSADSVVAAS